MSISDRLDEITARVVRAREGRITDRHMLLDVDVADLVAALRTVLDMHEGEPHAQGPDYCVECEQQSRCSTYAAIAAVLGKDRHDDQ